MTAEPGEALLSRIEDAGLNASAPPQQRWLDGWLLRFSPGKAKRARCVNAVAEGRLTLNEKLELATLAFQAAKLPLIVRLTPFSRPAELDRDLAARGFTLLDDTRVMVCDRLSSRPLPPLVEDATLVTLGPQAFAEAVGALRGSSKEERVAHAERLAASPVVHQAFGIRRQTDGEVLACGQFALEFEFAGLYDVFTAKEQRQKGLASWLCEYMLSACSKRGARIGYLQVESTNAPARSIYHRLGFVDRYAYHYCQAPSN